MPDCKWLALGLMALAAPVLAGGPMGQMFPDKSGCYARSYSLDHLNAHPEQLVTDIRLTPEGSVEDPMLGLWVDLMLRGDIAGTYTGLAYCEEAGAGLSCGMEGDAGSFTLAPDKGGKVLLDVGRYGMGFEGDAGFITLKSDRGDDRSFLLSPAPCR